ncbi:MAG: glutamate 5-kinase [Phycisphaeraceae bacterium]|nr:MAG: glutamate 5-kinase [Phycisphaeraceae bacterium]
MPDRAQPAAARRIVVKVGSAVLAPGGVLDNAAIARLTADIAASRARGVSVVLVSSGAVAAGFRTLGLTEMPRSIRDKQAAAAVGQPALVHRYAELFARDEITVAQVLLTGDVLDHRSRFLNARHTLTTLLDRGVVPIVNENDSVTHDEIKLGDNDRLSALVSGLVGADLLVILSSVDGLYEAGDPSRPIASVADTANARAHVTGDASSTGTGGFATKLDAVDIARAHSVPTIITRGPTDATPAPLAAVLDAQPVGTHFPLPEGASQRAARKNWIGHAAVARGRIHVDAGAARALTQRGASLLPKGITRVEGAFDAGAVVDVLDDAARPLARGLTNYSSTDLARIAGKRSDEIEAALGYTYADEAVHRDDMVVH